MLAAPTLQNLHTPSVPRFVAAPEGSAVPAIHPLAEDLRAVAKDHLTTLLRDALAGAGRHFAARAERAEDASRRRDLLDALHILRLSVAVIQRTFGVELERAFSVGDASPDAHSAVVCISPSCSMLWQELSHRLQALNADQAVAAITSGFSPEKIYAALRNSLDRTELPERAAVVIMELLDTGVMAHLDQLYRHMLERLDLYDLPEAGDELPAAANQSPATDAMTSAALRVDARTKVLLAKVSRSPNENPDSKYTNAQLASELLQSVRHQAAREGVNAHDRAVIQRLALVGRLFATIGADEHLPGDFRQNLESLCLPVIKSALADSNFFSHDIHPLRVIGTNLVRKAADQFLSGQAAESLDSLLQQAAAHFDLSAAFVRPMLAGLRPLSAEAVENFLAELRAYPGAHTVWRTERAHEIVSRVLQRRLIGNELPEETVALINQHWASTLTQRLLEQGHDSAGWREDLAAVDALVARDSEQAAEQYGPIPAIPAQVIPEPAEDIHAEPPAAALDAILAKAQPRAPEALDTLLQRGRWFRVYDHRQQSTRWLKVESYYPAHNSVAFAEFDGANPLCMEAAQFADDLCRGRSAPTNPDEQSRRVIAALQLRTQAA